LHHPHKLHRELPTAPPGSRKTDEGESFFDAQKREFAAQAAATKAAIAQLDPRTRVAMAGHEAGTYVRMRFSGEFGAMGLNGGAVVVEERGRRTRPAPFVHVDD
jgi:hypothetical protein